MASHAQMTSADSMHSSLPALLRHLTLYRLPEPASLQVGSHSLELQPQAHTNPELARELFAWANSLATPAVEVVRMDSGEGHFHVTGRITSGDRVKLYISAAKTPLTGYEGPLQRHGRVSVPLSMLGDWADTGVDA